MFTLLGTDVEDGHVRPKVRLNLMSQTEYTDREQIAEKKATSHKKRGRVAFLQNALWRFKDFCSLNGATSVRATAAEAHDL